ncbi:MAG: flippase [Nitrospiria bacterium]
MSDSPITTALSEIKIEYSFEKKLHKIERGGSILLLASIFGNGLNYLFGIYVARNLGSEQFGLYALGLAIFNIMVLIIPLGMEVGVIKFVSNQLGLGEYQKARSTIFQAMIITLLSSLMAAVFLLFLAKPVSVWLFHKNQLTLILILFTAALPLASVGTLLICSLQAFQIFFYTILIKYFWEPVGKFIFSALLFGLGFGLNGLLASIIFTLIISLIAGMISVNQVIGFSKRGFPYWDRHNFNNLVFYSFPLVISNIFGVIAPRSDVLILGYWVSAQEIGIYSAAFQTSAILALVLGAFDQTFAPLIGEVLARKEPDHLKQLYQAVSRWSFILTVPIFLLMVVFNEEILSMFGQEFLKGGSCLIILAAGQLFNMVTGSASTVLMMAGHSRKIMWNTILSGLLLILMNILLIPYLGQFGAAIGAAVSLIFAGLLRVIQIKKSYNIHPYQWSLAKPVIAGTFSIGMAETMKSFFNYNIFVLGAGVVLIYIVFLFFLKFEKMDLLLLTTLSTKAKGFLFRLKADFS